MSLSKTFSLKNYVSLITGGASGIGYQVSNALAEAGSNLIIASRRYDLCLEKCEEISKRYSVKTLAIKSDITKEKDIVKMVEESIKNYGKIDILVNNAGGSIVKETTETKLCEWNYIINLNLTSIFLCCREVGKNMIKRKSGKIINIASVLGENATDYRLYRKPENKDYFEQLSYSASKGGVINLTRDLAVSWAKYNINVNSISPGAFLTENAKEFLEEFCYENIRKRIPFGRWGNDNDLKGAIVFLSSEASKYVTGHNLIVDGGWSLWC